jgi:hypothetical protein
MKRNEPELSMNISLLDILFPVAIAWCVTTTLYLINSNTSYLESILLLIICSIIFSIQFLIWKFSYLAHVNSHANVIQLYEECQRSGSATCAVTLEEYHYHVKEQSGGIYRYYMQLIFIFICVAIEFFASLIMYSEISKRKTPIDVILSASSPKKETTANPPVHQNRNPPLERQPTRTVSGQEPLPGNGINWVPVDTPTEDTNTYKALDIESIRSDFKKALAAFATKVLRTDEGRFMSEFERQFATIAEADRVNITQAIHNLLINFFGTYNEYCTTMLTTSNAIGRGKEQMPKLTEKLENAAENDKIGIKAAITSLAAEIDENEGRRKARKDTYEKTVEELMRNLSGFSEKLPSLKKAATTGAAA